ncbi:MAG: hypothetical protein KF718_20995 [Polyangiaceae bacterium]|nr:hypothetical protein [Polyangiaceae bacterium]
MNKTLIATFTTTTALLLGCLALLARTSEPTPAPGPSAPASPLPATPESRPPALPEVIELEELRVVARPRSRPRATPSSAPPTPPARELVACSEWRELGPVYSVREGEQPRQRRVQTLCMAP